MKKTDFPSTLFLIPHNHKFKSLQNTVHIAAMGDNTTPFPSFTKKWHTTAYGALDPTLPALLATGKNVVITGGGTGIGAATALRFAQAGASSISILGRRPSPLTSTKSFIQASIPTAKIYTHVTDVTQKDSVTTTFKMIHESVGEIHVFVNNAGYASTPASIKDADSEDWWRGFEINIRGAFFATQAFLHFMAKDAVLINISSAVTHILYGPNGSSYSASKEGAVRFFADVQLEHPEVRVVNLQPGTIETDMARKVGVNGRDDCK